MVGIGLGTFSGSLISGIGIDVILLLVKGKLTLVVEGDTLYLVYDIKVVPFIQYTGKEKILSW